MRINIIYMNQILFKWSFRLIRIILTLPVALTLIYFVLVIIDIMHAITAEFIFNPFLYYYKISIKWITQGSSYSIPFFGFYLSLSPFFVLILWLIFICVFLYFQIRSVGKREAYGNLLYLTFSLWQKFYKYILILLELATFPLEYLRKLLQSQELPDVIQHIKKIIEKDIWRD